MKENSSAKSKWLSQFNRIVLLDSIATEIAVFGEKIGLKDFVQVMDMNCGALPAGSFEQVVDLDCPEQFLAMYTQIVHNRFAFAAINVNNANPQTMKIMEDYCRNVATANEICGVNNCAQAMQVFDAYVLNGMPSENVHVFEEKTQLRFVWQDEKDLHSAVWQKFGGSVELYRRLLQAFVNGLLNRCGFSFKIDGEKYIISADA